jgi:formyltetrahydrofolate deformylase
VIAEVSGLIAAAGANIVSADQYSDSSTSTFYARFAYVGATDPAPALRQWADGEGAAIWFSGATQKVVVCGSTEPHCVADLLERVEAGELACDVVAVVSDREVLAAYAERHGVPFVHVPVGDERAAQEEAFAAALDDSGADLVVLARYMRILPGWVAERWAGAMINIHHSTLPAFVGARAYERAYERGVKLVGATAHYVTEELDAGPIIAQGSVEVTHRCTVDDLRRTGRDVERVTLARAVRLHLEDRVIVAGERAVVFA